jgi:hypothetical protein
LEANSVQYGEIEVAEDKSGRMGVKVLDIDREIVVGFDQAHMKKKMGL